MKKRTQKTLSCLMAFFMVMLSATVTPIETVAAPSGIQQKIDTVRNVYDTGSYFTVASSTWGCTSGNHDVINGVWCQGCYLPSIPARGGLPSGADVGYTADTCCGFANYVYYCIFGHNSATSTTLTSKPVFGDLVHTGSHWFIYLSEDNSNYYVYDANGYNSGKNKVTYNNYYPKSAVSSLTVYHATNYDTIAGSSTPHTHTFGSFAFYLSTHPHENCYHCTGCSEIIRDWSSSNKLNNCIECNRPDKPAFFGMKSEYSVEDTITFKWSSDSNTTHTNFWLYAKDGNDWILIEKKDYATSGLQRKLSSGEYRVEIVAYNSNYWDENHIDHIYSVSPFYYFKVNRVVDSSNNFEDVKSTSWFKQAVDYSVENGLMFGVSNNRFDPEGSTTRAMFVTVLWRLEGKPKTNNNVPFTDVKENWYNDAVAWAYSNKIVSGTDFNKFSPDKKITREQMAAILYRYAQKKGYDVTASTNLNTFPDGESTSSYARDALSWAYGSGLIFGADGKLLPLDGATRAQVAAILMRYTQKVVK